MLRGEGGAETGDGVGQAGFVAGDGVHLPFANQGGLVVEDGLAGFVEGEEDVGFPEERGFGGVDVFPAAWVLAELATGEGDDVAVVVADGKHQAVAKAREKPAAIALEGEAGIDEVAAAELVLAGPIEENRRGIRGPADFPADGHFLAETTGFQVVAGVGGGGGAEEEGVEKAGGLAVEVEQASAGLAVAFFAGVEGFLDDRHVDSGGEFFDRIGEGEVLEFADEVDGIAAFFAAEAVEELVGGVDGKRGGFLVVKRAEGLEAGAGAFHGDVRADDVHDVRGGQHLLDGFPGDLGHGEGCRTGRGSSKEEVASAPEMPGQQGAEVMGPWTAASCCRFEPRSLLRGVDGMRNRSRERLSFHHPIHPGPAGWLRKSGSRLPQSKEPKLDILSIFEHGC